MITINMNSDDFKKITENFLKNIVSFNANKDMIFKIGEDDFITRVSDITISDTFIYYKNIRLKINTLKFSTINSIGANIDII